MSEHERRFFEKAHTMMPHLSVDIDLPAKQSICKIAEAIFTSEKHSVLVVEFPEACLHPWLQVELVRGLFTYAIREKNMYIVYTTHSPYMVFSIPDVVEVLGKHADEIAAVYYVYKESDRLNIRKLDMDEFGYVTEFPEVAQLEADLWHRQITRYRSRGIKDVTEEDN